MREISPAIGMTVDEWLSFAPEIKPRIMEIRRQKEAGERQRPSTVLLDRSGILAPQSRKSLLDKIAKLVDENYAGRSEMCQQFADLLNRVLSYLKFPSRGVMGVAIYYDAKGKELFRWNHAWVRAGEEVIDGNVDSLIENPVVPKQVNVRPYWGPISGVPGDRRLRENHGIALPADVDVDGTWWPELKEWVDTELTHPSIRFA
jgi:hypothetical protein